MEESASGTAYADAAGTTLDALRRIIRALRLANGGAETTGLSAAQLYVLAQVAERPGASLVELATRTLTDRTSVAAVVDRLCARGLLERDRATDDRRRSRITATEAGLAVLARAPHPPTQRLLDGLKALDDEALRHLADGLTALVHGMGLGDEPASMFFEDDPTSAEAEGQRGSAAAARLTVSTTASADDSGRSLRDR